MAHLTVKLADTMAKIGVSSVYGDPVELGDTTIVPVALSYFGFGAGDDGSESGAGGGGGGGLAVPIGAYVHDGAGVRFEPNPVSLLAVGIPFVWVSGRALRMVFRALGRNSRRRRRR